MAIDSNALRQRLGMSGESSGSSESQPSAPRIDSDAIRQRLGYTKPEKKEVYQPIWNPRTTEDIIANVVQQKTARAPYKPIQRSAPVVSEPEEKGLIQNVGDIAKDAIRAGIRSKVESGIGRAVNFAQLPNKEKLRSVVSFPTQAIKETPGNAFDALKKGVNFAAQIPGFASREIISGAMSIAEAAGAPETSFTPESKALRYFVGDDIKSLQNRVSGSYDTLKSLGATDRQAGILAPVGVGIVVALNAALGTGSLTKKGIEKGIGKNIEKALLAEIDKVAPEYATRATITDIKNEAARLAKLPQAERAEAFDEALGRFYPMIDQTDEAVVDSAAIRQRIGIPEPETPGVQGVAAPQIENVATRQIDETIEPTIQKEAAQTAGKESEQVVETKTSKVASSIEANAIEKKLADDLGELAEYNPVTVKDQAERATYLINNDIERAKNIIRGNEKLPSDLLGGTMIKAMEEYAVKNGDSAVLRDLAGSPLTSATSVHAQEMRMLAERNPDSPLAAIQTLQKAREARIERQIGKKKTIAQEKMDVMDDIKKEVASSTAKYKDWDSFLDSLKC